MIEKSTPVGIAFDVFDKNGHRIGQVEELAGNPASALYQIGRFIISQRGDIDEETVYRFKQYYLATRKNFAGIDTGLTGCRQTFSLGLNQQMTKLYLEWAIQAPENRDSNVFEQIEESASVIETYEQLIDRPDII